MAPHMRDPVLAFDPSQCLLLTVFCTNLLGHARAMYTLACINFCEVMPQSCTLTLSLTPAFVGAIILFAMIITDVGPIKGK